MTAQSESALEATLALDQNHMFYSHYILNSYILSVMRTSHPDTGFLTRMRDFCGLMYMYVKTMSEIA